MILGWVRVETYNRDSGVVKTKYCLLRNFNTIIPKRFYADLFQIASPTISADYYTDMQETLEIAYAFMHCQ